MRLHQLLRPPLRFLAAVALLGALLYGMAWLVRPDVSGRAPARSAEAIEGVAAPPAGPAEPTVVDRIVLTVLISLGAAVMVWAIAVPAGIYAAVRERAPGGRALMLISFPVMCVPPLVLALVLAYLTRRHMGVEISALFARPRHAQAAWGWPKVAEMLRHIWLPVVLVGAGATAGMIRLMRRRLLEEMGKPHVTAARARGTGGGRLLRRYSLRPALIPFVSAMGRLFPRLVSGGVIVAIVLSLPTVGPVMRWALRAGDFQLAGAVLAVLTLLAATGAMACDLLRRWLDPRTRSAAGRPMEPGRADRITGGPSLRQWQPVRRRFAPHKAAVASAYVLAAIGAVAAAAESIAPYPAAQRDPACAWCPPQPPRIGLRHGLYVYAVQHPADPAAGGQTSIEDRADIVPLGLFVKGAPYRLWGLIRWDRHLLGVDRDKYRAAHPAGAPTPTFHLLGADGHGRDVFSRLVYGCRVSLSIGLAAAVVAFVVGMSLGGLAGYTGGRPDKLLQRAIRTIDLIPPLPLWLMLAAVIRLNGSPLWTCFGIAGMLGLLGWTGLARVVRGGLRDLRREDYALAARLTGAGHGRILVRHLLGGLTGDVLAAVTRLVPAMILGETCLSFLGLGLRPPWVSWGVMLHDCMSIRPAVSCPWLLLPAALIVLTFLGFHLLGDGLRDAGGGEAAHV